MHFKSGGKNGLVKNGVKTISSLEILPNSLQLKKSANGKIFKCRKQTHKSKERKCEAYDGKIFIILV